MTQRRHKRGIISCMILSVLNLVAVFGIVFIFVNSSSAKKRAVVDGKQKNDSIEIRQNHKLATPKVIAVDGFTVSSSALTLNNYNQTTDNSKEVIENEDYIIADSSSRILTEEDVFGLTKEQIRIAKNEIYARHGWIFKDKSLQQYFESKDWYTGLYTEAEFSDDELNEIEKKNAAFLHEYQEKTN